MEISKKINMRFLIEKLVSNRLISSSASEKDRRRWLESSPEIQEEELVRVLDARKSLATSCKTKAGRSH